MNPFTLICSACGASNHPSQTLCRVCKEPLSRSNISPSPPSPLSPTRKVLKQRYRIMLEVGKGGMGTVYMGRDMQLGGRLVAIKEMSQFGLTPEEEFQAAQNFQREAHLLAKLQHPNLPSIYDHFEENQRWYLVMSFVKGQTLEEYLETRGGKLPPDEVIQIGLTLCNVLQYLHTHNPPIIFRDLKPSNIMRAVDGHIYLIDFGIARFFKPGKPKDTTDRGSPGYAAPEQFGHTQTSPSSDIYSLGVILYELFSGFDIAITTFHFPPLDTLAPAVPPYIVKLISQMTDIDERKRPQNVEFVKRGLQNLKQDAAPSATSGQYKRTTQTSPTTTRKKSKRGLITALVVAGVILLLLAFYTLHPATNPAHIGKTTAANTTTLAATNGPLRVLNTFCNAMNSENPDFQTAYAQFSSQYQSKYSLTNFQIIFQGASRCVISSSPNDKNMAELNMTLTCPPPPDGGPPPQGTPPPGNNPPPDGHHDGPRPIKKPVDLTLTKDGSNGWKIASITVVDYHCGPPPTAVPPPPKP